MILNAGNRSSSTFWNSGGTNLTTTLSYGHRNQLTGTSNYLLAGGVGSGAVTYAFDAEGNMTSRSLPGSGTGWGYTWNDDNRLERVDRTQSDDLFLWKLRTEYRYDFAGQRILKRAARDPMIIGGPQPQRTRYFFSGLTETIRKVSVGTHADTSFAFVNKEDGSATGWAQGVGTGGSVTSVYDSARRSNVARFLNGGRFDKGMNNETRRVASFWFKRGLYNPTIVFHIQTSAGDRRINLYTTSGTNGFSGLDYAVYLGSGVANGQWHRIERDLGAIVSSLTPGVTFTKTYGTWIWSSDCYLDDLRFSNSITSEHAVLAPGAIGHIVRRRTIDTTTYLATATDRFLHYDQVGSVHHESNAAGNAVTKHYQDSFGNTVASWNTGMWGGARGGFHHNTKEFDEDAELVYMHQRWYLPEVGVFLSSAPYPAMIEQRYGFVLNMPNMFTDTKGRIIDIGGDPCERELLRAALDALRNTNRLFRAMIDFLQSSDQTYIITGLTGRGSFYDPSTRVIGINIMDRSSNRPLIVTLAHELVHAWDHDRGTLNGNGSPNGNWPIAEDKAVDFENHLRVRLGKTPRVNYGDTARGIEIPNGAGRGVPCP